MTERSNPFAELGDMPSFERKPKPARPAENEALDVIAEETGFVSRQPAKTAKAPKRKPRLHRTGRNVNFTLKVTAETRDRFYKLADQKGVILGRVLELALDALEKQTAVADGPSVNNN